MLDLEPGRAHGDAQCLGFIGAGNGAAIIVGKHHDGATRQAGAKHTFTTHVKIIAIDQRVHDKTST